jgi:hypothetical protein
MESGTPKEVADRARASEVSQAYMKIAGVSKIAELQKLTMAQMLDAQRKLFETRFGRRWHRNSRRRADPTCMPE